MRNIFVGSLIALGLTIAAANAGDVPIANPPSVKVETLLGAANKPGLFIVRSHLPADGLVKPHSHDISSYIEVLSGTLYSCISGTVSAATATAHKAGEFFEIPANQVHCSWGKDGAVDYLEIRIGPMTTKSVDK